MIGFFKISAMQRTLTQFPVDSLEVESNPLFNVVIAYEDFETGKHAKETYDFLAENLGNECQLTNQMWKFDVLGIPKLREIAVRDATTADIIIVAGHGGPLPEPVTRWVESWIMEGTRALALVALLDQSENQFRDSLTVRQYLANAASHANLEFFVQPSTLPTNGTRNNLSFVSGNTSATGQTLARLAGIVQRDSTSSRWGINE
jgi:hypothetical protein